MRDLSALLAVATLSANPAPVTAMDLSEVSARLATIDRDLTTCLQAQMSAKSILPGAVRDCIAAARPGDHTLRKDLNGWIPMLAGTDPEREDAQRTRQALNVLRSFMNQLDTALLYRRAAIDPIELDKTVQAACQKSRIIPAKDEAEPQTEFFIGSLCD